MREQDYIRRPLDLLRVHHEKIEAWILEQAGVAFDAKAATKPGLRHTGLRCQMQRFVAGVNVAAVVYVEYLAPDLVVVTVIDIDGV